MKIGLVVPALYQGGGVPAVARFIKDAALGDGRFDLKLVSLSTSANDPQSMRFTAPHTWLLGVGTSTGQWEGLPFTHVGAMGGEIEFQRYRRRSQLSSVLSDCDLIQVVGGCPAWANATIGLGKPVALATASRAQVERRRHAVQSRGWIGRWRKSMTAITARMDDMALRRVDAIQVMNPSMLEYARQLNAGRDVDVCYAPPGVNAALFRPLVRRSPDQQPYILCVGRMADPRKRIELLLDAFARLPAALRGEVRMILAGASAPPQEFWQHADALGLRDNITWVQRPQQDALVRLYQEASVLVLPSDEEGFGVVVIEAMACAVPVISTRSGGPEGIISDGVDGYLIPLDDAQAMADRLQALLCDPVLNIQMGLHARRTIEQRYDERVASQVFVDVWTRMAHRAGVPL